MSARVWLSSFFVVAVAAAAGCRTREGTLVAVSVDAKPALPGVDRLHVRATAGKATSSFDVALAQKSIPPVQVFGIDVPGNHTGDLTVEVDAQTASGSSLGKQSDTVKLSPGDIVTLSLTIGIAPPDLAMGNDLAGSDGSTPDAASVPDQSTDALVTPPDLVPTCALSSDCTDPGRPICGADGVCRACTGPSDDTACLAHSLAACVTNGAKAGSCGECDPILPNFENMKCMGPAADMPVCTDTATCRACNVGIECASGVCEMGICIGQSEVAHVGKGGPCMNAKHNSQPPNPPYCEISAATTDGAHYILVNGIGGGDVYAPLTFTDAIPGGTLTIIGPGPLAVQPAQVYQKAMPSVNISFTQGTDTDGTLVIRGMSLSGIDGSNYSDYGVKCSNTTGAKVTIEIYDSLIDYSNQGGILTNGCNLKLVRSTVQHASGRGVAMTGGDATIDRAFVRSNYSGGIARSGAGVMQIFNTLVADNGNASATNAGIVASGGTLRITSSTIARNFATSTLQTGIVGTGSTCFIFNTICDDQNGEPNLVGCGAAFSAWSTAPVDANNNVDTSDCTVNDYFVNYDAQDFHLKGQASIVCPIYNAGGASFNDFTAPTIDLDGSPRPAFGAYDIGAYEKQ